MLISCRSSKQEKQDGSAQQPIPFVENKLIAPGHCRIVGTIVHIHSILVLTDKTSPCSKAPCLASVRVDSIIGYGSSFIEPLSAGDTVFIKFMFTLSPTTKELFPDMTELYPGLSMGSQFVADVVSDVPGKLYQKRSDQFLIYGYKRQ